MQSPTLFCVVSLGTIKLVAVIVAVISVYLLRRMKTAAAEGQKRTWPASLEKLAGAIIVGYGASIVSVVGALLAAGEACPLLWMLVAFAGPTALLEWFRGKSYFFGSSGTAIEYAIYIWLLVPPRRPRIAAYIAGFHFSCALAALALWYWKYAQR
jgi:hypothetical protein